MRKREERGGRREERGEGREERGERREARNRVKGEYNHGLRADVRRLRSAPVTPPLLVQCVAPPFLTPGGGTGAAPLPLGLAQEALEFMVYGLGFGG